MRAVVAIHNTVNEKAWAQVGSALGLGLGLGLGSGSGCLG